MDPTSGGPRMERRIVTVLFADLVGFTTLAETLDVEDVAAVQDAYFAGVRDAVGRHGGRLEKFIGDAAVAAFGADRTREDDAERAVRAGLAVTALVASLAARLGLDDAELDVRVGIQTGEVAVATDGPDAGRLTGDTMNTAARLQAAAAPGTVLCGRPAVLATAHAVAFGELEPLTLKGKAEPVLAAVAHGTLPEASRAAAMGDLSAPMVGRDAELWLLGSALGRAANGATERWTVIADPGVGKSRLLAELRARAVAGGTLVWAARVRAGEVVPFAAVVALVRDALGAEPDPLARLVAAGVSPDRAEVLAAEARALLASFRPGAGDGGTAAPGGGGSRADLAAERSARFGAWVELLDGLAGSRPQLWLIEDVHGAGGDLRAFLAFAGSTPAPGGRLILAATRPVLLDRAPDWPAASGGHRLDLAPLAGDAPTVLVRALIGDALPDRLVAAIVERADGSPLFIEELLRSWASLGVLVRDGDAWCLTVEPDAVPLPETVQALYAAQLDDLPAAAREVARRASVAGRRFAERLLAELGLPEGPVRDGLALLLRGSLVEGPREDALLGPGYRYRHALLRDAGYASLARGERVRLHLAVARWLASLPGAREAVAETIGRQLAAAAAVMPAVAASRPEGEDPVVLRGEAAGWLTLAAARAVRMAAHDAAEALLRDALALTDPEALLPLAERTARLGEVLAASGSTEAAGPVLEDACARFADLLVGSDGAEVRAGYATATVATIRVLLDRLRFHEGVEVAHAALELLGLPAPDADADAARIHLARAHAEVFDTGRGEAALGVAAMVSAFAERMGDRELELEALRLEMVATAESGASVSHLLDRQVVLIEALGRTQLLGGVRVNQAMARLGDRTAEMGPLLEEADRLARAHGQPQHLAWARYARAEAALLLGDWDAAVRWGREGLGIAERNGYLRAAARTWFVLRPIAVLRGDEALLGELAGWYASLDDPPGPPYARLMLAAVGVSLPSDAAILGPDADHVREVWPLAEGNPSFVAARDAVLQAWWDAGRFDDVIEAVALLPADEVAGPLLVAGAALWRARLGIDESVVVDEARRALELAGRWDAAWWMEQAIAILDDAGAATPDERSLRRSIRVRLLGTPAS
ncbi:MAG: adenylate/guanylate cyclase domain-containing protein [Chloroflexota bacterium]